MNKKIKSITITAMMTALIFAVTFFIRIPLLSTGGYLNLGDVIIIVAALLLNNYYSLFAGGVGSALADILSGYSIYAPMTFIIKALVAFFILIMQKNGESRRKFIVGAFLAESAMVILYFFFEFFVFNSKIAIFNVPFNCIQLFVTIIISFLSYKPIIGLRNRIKLR